MHILQTSEQRQKKKTTMELFCALGTATVIFVLCFSLLQVWPQSRTSTPDINFEKHILDTHTHKSTGEKKMFRDNKQTFLRSKCSHKMPESKSLDARRKKNPSEFDHIFFLVRSPSFCSLAYLKIFHFI